MIHRGLLFRRDQLSQLVTLDKREWFDQRSRREGWWRQAVEARDLEWTWTMMILSAAHSTAHSVGEAAVLCYSGAGLDPVTA